MSDSQPPTEGFPAIDLPDAGFHAPGDPSRPPPRFRTDRVAGVLLILLGSAVALEAWTFRVAFLTDPLGPRALPLLVAGLLVLCGLLLVRKPGPDPVWPRAGGLLRGAGGAVVFLLYGLLMEPLGFGLGTVGAVVGLGVLFGGPPKQAALVGVVVAAVLWVLFVPLLGIPLPLGWLFTGGRG